MLRWSGWILLLASISFFLNPTIYRLPATQDGMSLISVI